MLGVVLVQNSHRLMKKPVWVKTWKQSIKNYKKSGIKLMDAVLLSPDGQLMSQEGEKQCITLNDVQILRDILLNQPGCKEVLHLDNLYYCVKQLTEDMIVLFNGSNYIIACVTDCEHFLLVNIKARRPECEQTAAWIQDVATQLQDKYS